MPQTRSKVKRQRRAQVDDDDDDDDDSSAADSSNFHDQIEVGSLPSFNLFLASFLHVGTYQPDPSKRAETKTAA